jgi:hypothetical protein
VVADDAADHACAEILGVGERLLGQRGEDIAGQEVCGGKRDAIFLAQHVDQRVDRAGGGDAGIEARLAAEEGEGLAVEHHLEVGEAAGARGTDPVRPGDRHGAGGGEADLLVLGGDDLEGGVVVEGEGLGRGEVIGQRPKEGEGVGLVRRSGRAQQGEHERKRRRCSQGDVGRGAHGMTFVHWRRDPATGPRRLVAGAILRAKAAPAFGFARQKSPLYACS